MQTFPWREVLAVVLNVALWGLTSCELGCAPALAAGGRSAAVAPSAGVGTAVGEVGPGATVTLSHVDWPLVTALLGPLLAVLCTFLAIHSVIRVRGRSADS